MCDQEVESCDCVDEETECSNARVQEGGADTAGSFSDFRRNASKQFLSSAQAIPHQAGDA